VRPSAVESESIRPGEDRLLMRACWYLLGKTALGNNAGVNRSAFTPDLNAGW